jgi:hypothetical protein
MPVKFIFPEDCEDSILPAVIAGDKNDLDLAMCWVEGFAKTWPTPHREKIVMEVPALMALLLYKHFTIEA